MRLEPLLLTAISRRIAERFDILASSLCSEKGHGTCDSLHRYYGAELFCCPTPSCSRHKHGFKTRDKREAHAAKHQRPFKCGVVNCQFSSIGFESEAGRTDHMSNCHNSAQQAEMTWEDMDNKSCFRVLCSAARERELGLVQSLLSLTSRNIVDLESVGKLLIIAGEGQSVDVIDVVISACESIRETMAFGKAWYRLNKQVEKALHNAALRGLEALVRGLCRSKLLTDLNATSRGALDPKRNKDHRGHAPLHLAVLGQSDSIVELLLDSGASACLESKKDRSTALHLAASCGSKVIARLLLDREADIEARADGWTALHLAATNGHDATARLLLDRGADIDAKNASGETALLRESAAGREDIARL